MQAGLFRTVEQESFARGASYSPPEPSPGMARLCGYRLRPAERKGAVENNT